MATIGSALKFAFGKVDGVDHRRRRLLGIVQGVVSGLASRFIGVAIGLVSVPVTIGYLGPERYGVWALLGSLLAWIRLADLGIGNGLTNNLAQAFGTGEHEQLRNHVSTALLVLSAIALALAAILGLAWSWIDWSGLFGLQTALGKAEVGPAILASAAIFLLGFPLAVIGPSFNAMQEGKLANYWGIAGSLASLVALIVVTTTHGGLVWLVLAVSGTGLVVNAASGFWLYTHRHPVMSPRFRSFQRSSAKDLMQVGIQFFLIQIMALFVFETDNLIVAHYLGAAHVPAYSLTYTLFGFTSLIQTLLFKYVWVAYTEAIARRDMAWVRRTFSLSMAFSLGSTFVLVIPLIFIAQPFISMWASHDVVPPSSLVWWMAAWTMINAFCSPIACLFAAASHMKAQVIYSAVSAAANMALSIYLVQRWGVTGVIAATAMAYLVFVCGPASVDVALLLRRRLHVV